jgi:hypothetical protein
MNDPHPPTRIDMHVHMVGNGMAGSGGWLRLNGWHRWLAAFMLTQLGMPAGTLTGDLEKLYAEYVLRLVRESSLDAIVLLAHERVHDPDGTPREDLGSMFVPNDVVLALAKNHLEFLAGVSIHPARHDALDELDRCVAARRCSHEMPSKLSEHRYVGHALHSVLEKDGRIAPAFARAHRRRTHPAGNQRRVR